MRHDDFSAPCYGVYKGVTETGPWKNFLNGQLKFVENYDRWKTQSFVILVLQNKGF